jgi:hypothetical protein
VAKLVKIVPVDPNDEDLAGLADHEWEWKGTSVYHDMHNGEYFVHPRLERHVKNDRT